VDLSSTQTIAGAKTFSGSVAAGTAVSSPKYCIGTNCITAWPSGGGTGVTLTSPDTSITVGGTAVAPTVKVNTSLIQARVGSACGSNSAMSGISQTGAPTCVTVSGGGAVTFPVKWSNAPVVSTAQAVLNVTNTATGPAEPSSNPGASYFATVPVAIAATASGSQVTVGLLGQATGTEGIGVMAYTATSNLPALMAMDYITGYVPSGTGDSDWPKAIDAETMNAGSVVIQAEANATTAPVQCTGNRTPAGCGQTIGVKSNVDATSGVTEAFEGNLSSPSATGLSLNFNVAPTSGNMINAGVNCSNGGNCPYFQVDGYGNVWVSGNLSVSGNVNKSSGNFKIDHPLDPANKYLYHSFVESPDMKNVYDGMVVLNKKGEAVVELPDYFEALNQDFRYQLTSIGRFMPLYIATEIKGNKFTIAGGKPGAKVSWQVTGIRHDAYAEAHRIQVEENKTGKERGTYMHPELFQPEPPALARK
jgi:hypothetical protein